MRHQLCCRVGKAAVLPFVHFPTLDQLGACLQPMPARSLPGTMNVPSMHGCGSAEAFLAGLSPPPA